jgi:iduronate 2-sulfatase
MHPIFCSRIACFAIALLFLGECRSAFAAQAPATGARRPNILFIASDDLNNDLGTYGNPVVQTPNLDKLATQGVRFDRAYCQFPLCNPSRASIMTGLRPDTLRVYSLTYHFRTEFPDIVTMSQMFMNAGYYAARVGKIYHYNVPSSIGTSGFDDWPSWTEYFNPSGTDHTRLEPEVRRNNGGRGAQGVGLGYLSDPADRDEDQTDGMVATKAIELLEKHKDQPFFLAVGFFRPHTPYIAPKKYFDLHPLEKIVVPEIPADFRASVPAPALQGSVNFSNEDKALGIQGYYASISYMDAQVGRILAALDRLNLRDYTIIVFWSDHGYALARHGLWEKLALFEEVARVPLIIAGPGIRAGTPSPRVVELLDVYPTLADLAGLSPPANLQGASLKPLLTDPARAWNRPAFSQVERAGFPGRTVRTEGWRYTEWDEGRQGRELYDEAKDPGEMKNLASDPAYAATIAELQALVRKNWPVRVIGGGGRGDIPRLTAAQTTRINDLFTAGIAAELAAVTAARAELTAASLAGTDAATLLAAANARLGAAELALANKRATAFAALQSSNERLKADQAAFLMSNHGGPAVRGGGPTEPPAPNY